MWDTQRLHHDLLKEEQGWTRDFYDGNKVAFHQILHPQIAMDNEN